MTVRRAIIITGIVGCAALAYVTFPRPVQYTLRITEQNQQFGVQQLIGSHEWHSVLPENFKQVVLLYESDPAHYMAACVPGFKILDYEGSTPYNTFQKVPVQGTEWLIVPSSGHGLNHGNATALTLTCSQGDVPFWQTDFFTQWKHSSGR